MERHPGCRRFHARALSSHRFGLSSREAERGILVKCPVSSRGLRTIDTLVGQLLRQVETIVTRLGLLHEDSAAIPRRQSPLGLRLLQARKRRGKGHQESKQASNRGDMVLEGSIGSGKVDRGQKPSCFVWYHELLLAAVKSFFG